MAEEAPPAYDSIFGKIVEAKATSDGNIGFATKVSGIIFGSFAWTIVLALFLTIPISCIIIGALYLDDCPAERYIPIYLIVSGCFTFVKNVSSLIQKCLRRNDDEQDEQGGSKLSNLFEGLIGCFLFAWFICGNVWIYGTFKHFSTDASQPNYCHPTLFYFSFWLLNASYIIIGLSCFMCCCLCFTLFCCAKNAQLV